MREVVDFNYDWRFYKGDIDIPRPYEKGPTYTQSKTERKLIGPAAYHYFDEPDAFYPGCEHRSIGWKKIDLPHDFIIDQENKEQENNAHGYFTYCNAWYRKHFTLPTEYSGKRITLIFEGVASAATVYLNGCLMAHNFSAYNTFEVDISDNVYFDKENILAVYVSTDEFEGWWYQGGGIYRNVTLNISDPVAIDLWGVYAPYKKLDDDTWQIDFETTVLNTSYEDAVVMASSQLVDKNGNVVASSSGKGEVSSRDKSVLKYCAKVKAPLLWSPDTPNLYTVVTKLYINGEEIDNNTTRIGFRTVEITAEGLFINGEKTIIKGVCGHQDFGLMGLVTPRNIAFYKMKLLKEMGANGYRTSHYQYSADYMDAFDELGFLVMDEARWFESTKEGIEQLEGLIKRDRNRPSVIFWSTGNEEPYHVTDVGRRIHKALAHHIRKLDNTRLITAAVDRTPDTCTIYNDCDIVGINYNLNIYDKVHETYPEKPLFASECGAATTTRDWHYPTNTNARNRDEDVDVNSWFLCHETTWRHLMERPYVIGGYIWDGFEHRGEAIWPAVCSRSGAVDLFLQKKGGFYQFKSFWTKGPMVHIVPHWNFNGMEGTEIQVTVYTNCQQLELFLNGKSLGVQAVPKFGRGSWQVPFESGCLEVKGYIDGCVVATHSRTTTGKAVGLKLTPFNDFEINGRDVALFLCEAVDELGNTVPDAAPFVEFTTDVPAVIVGTGSDNTDHTSVTLPYRKMYMGKILVGIRPAEGQASVELYATAEGLQGAHIKINK